MGVCPSSPTKTPEEKAVEWESAHGLLCHARGGFLRVDVRAQVWKDGESPYLPEGPLGLCLMVGAGKALGQILGQSLSSRACSIWQLEELLCGSFASNWEACYVSYSIVDGTATFRLDMGFDVETIFCPFNRKCVFQIHVLWAYSKC